MSTQLETRIKPLHSPRMALRRQIATCLGLLAAGALLLGCGGSDEPKSASISPDTADDLTAKLDVIQERVANGDCSGATVALGFLEEGVDNVSADTGEQFTADMKDLLSQLGDQIDSQCQPIDDPSSTTSSTTTSSTEATTSEETSTETEPAETTSTDTHTDPSDPPETNVPGAGQGPPGHDDGGTASPSNTGGITPEKKKPGKKPKDEKKSKPTYGGKPGKKQ